MLKKSNLYVEKIYSEHPLAAWSLDDDISFYQVLTSAQQNALDTDEWSYTNLTPTSASNHGALPILNSPTSQFTKGAGTGTLDATFTITPSTDLDSNKSTVCISAYIYDTNRMTYTLSDGAAQSYWIAPQTDGWHLISVTFIVTGSFSPKLDITGPTGDFQITALSVGQWSEAHNSHSVGFNEVDLPASIEPFISQAITYSAVPMDAYGIDDESNGYYLVKNNTAYCRPGGIPLAFGSHQTIAISPAPDTNPSMIFPGIGFLNDSGKHNNYTLEAWIRVYNSSVDPIRIIGPVASTDGVYLEEGFISIYVGQYTQSYFVGKFDRPMLLSFQYSETRVSLMINGEQIISMDIDIGNIDFPVKESGGYSQDWIGVYGSEHVDPFEIDAISIFPYLLPPEIAKRHFVFGQGVQDYNFSNKDFLKKTVQFDFPYSEYSHNVIYPDSNKWRSGFSVNMDTTSSYLSATKHTLPELIVNGDGSSSDIWFADNRAQNTTVTDFFPYVIMNPSSTFTESSIYFDNLNILSDKVEAVVGVFKSPYSSASGIVMEYSNKTNGDKLQIRLDGTTLNYNHIDPLGAVTNLHNEAVPVNTYFTAGINIPRLALAEFGTLQNFFSNRDRVSLSIGGTISGDTINQNPSTFTGRIYSTHFDNKYFFNKDLDVHFSGPYVMQDGGVTDLVKYIGNYSLLPIYKNVTMGFDIGAASYWEDVIPLSMFGKNISASAGGSYYDLDMIQFNVDTPYRQGLNDDFLSNLFYYTLNAYLGLETKTYADFNALGYTSYQDLNDDWTTNASGLRYSTSFDSFITLQKYDVAGNVLYSSFSDIVSASANKVVALSASPTTTKYEVFDNHILMIPENIDFSEYYLGIHLEMKIRGTLEKNMAVKRMELSSFVFNDGLPTKIGTKYSIPVYPLPIGGP